MTDRPLNATGGAAAVPLPRDAALSDFVALLKPRVMSLVIFTALVGLMIAPDHVHPVLAFTSILCIAVGAGASGALNMAYEGDVDALMTRTANRPIPRGRITHLVSCLPVSAQEHRFMSNPGPGSGPGC